MKNFFQLILVLTVSGFAIPSHARVFDLGRESVAAYFRGTGGLSHVGNEAFIHSSGNQSVMDAEVDYNFSGEIGLVVALMEQLRAKMGLELLQTKSLETTATDINGMELFTLTSDVFVMNPTFTLEYAHYSSSGLRFFTYAGIGWANVTLENKYDMTALGSGIYGGVTDYTEKSGTERFSYHLGIGLETHFSDTSTFVFDVGYRLLSVDGLKYKSSESTINGATPPVPVNKGDPVRNMDGTARTFDLGGFYIGLGFRFYLGGV